MATPPGSEREVNVSETQKGPPRQCELSPAAEGKRTLLQSQLKPREKALTASFRLHSSSLGCHKRAPLPTVTGAERPPQADTDAAHTSEWGGEEGRCREALTSAGSIRLVLYKERQSSRTSFPRPSPGSLVHLVSIPVASLTQGFFVTLILREKNARHWKY